MSDKDFNAQDEQDDSVLVKRNPRKHVYILPNLFTLAALFAGFYAIIMAVNGEFQKASIGIFCAMILDSLDGRVARLTKTESEFGAQFDSLSDMVSFAAAPALVVYIWALKDLGKLGWLVAFIYCACGALRLARFNTNIGVVDKRFFQGLPSPAAAAIVVSFIWSIVDYGVEMSSGVITFALIFTLFAGLSMVSSIPFYSFKVVNARKAMPFIKVAYIALAFAFILVIFAYKPPQTMFILFMGYGLSGYFIYIQHRMKGKKVSIVQPHKAYEPAGGIEEKAGSDKEK